MEGRIFMISRVYKHFLTRCKILKRLINLTAFKVRTFMYKKTHEESEEAKYKLGE